MKSGKLRLMKIFDIESQYQKHKSRLLSIRTLDAKRRVSHSTIKNVEAINSYKKNRLTSDLYLEKEKISKITNENSQLHANLIKVYKRDPEKNPLMRHNTSKSSLRSISSSGSRLEHDNAKMKNRIAATKSTYHKFTRIQTNITRRKFSDTSRNELAKML